MVAFTFFVLDGDSFETLLRWKILKLKNGIHESTTLAVLSLCDLSARLA